MASKVLKSISKDDVERARLMSEYKYAVDLQSKLVTEKRKGKEEGKKEGMKEGMKKGIEQGMQKGEQKILDLLKSGKSPEEILKDYGVD